MNPQIYSTFLLVSLTKNLNQNLILSDKLNCMIKNEPSRDPKAKREDFVSTLQDWSDYLLSPLPEEERELAEHLIKLSTEDLASSEDKIEDNIVNWLGGLEARIQSSNCDSDYYRILGHSLVSALNKYVRQEEPSKKVVDACKNCLKATFEKIWGQSLTTNAPQTKGTEQQQLESLQRFEDAIRLLEDVARLVRESVFDQNEVKLILTRTGELLNFSPQNTDLDRQRRGNEGRFFWLVAGEIIPYMMGQKEIACEDQIINYPKKLEEYLEQLTLLRPQTGLLIEKFLAVLNQRNGINNLYGALQTQAPGSQ